MRSIISFFLFFMISDACAQFNFWYDDIYRLEVCTPNSKYKSSGINEVRITEYWPREKNKIVSQRQYNKYGYLVGVINTDFSFIPGREVIDIEHAPGNVFAVKRKIGTLQFRKIAPGYVHTFWGVYYTLKRSDEILKLTSPDTVSITDSAEWAPDSSIICRTFLEGNLIGTDTAVTIYTKMSPPVFRKCEIAWKNELNDRRDSIVICSSPVAAGNYHKEIYTFEKRILKKKLSEYFSADTLQSKFIVNYYYNKGGEKYREETINWLGDTIELKVYNYKRGADYLYYIKEYSRSGELTSTTYFDRYDHVVMRVMPPVVYREDISLIKEKYTYLDNGLMSLFRVWYDDKLVYVRSYYYTRRGLK